MEVNGQPGVDKGPRVIDAFIEWQKDDGSAISEVDDFEQDLTVSAAFRVFIPVTSIKFEKSKYPGK